MCCWHCTFRSQKHTHWEHYGDALRSSLMLCSFCNRFARWWVLQKVQKVCQKHTHELITAMGQSTESPILFRSCGPETPFSDQKGASKIGDSVLCNGLPNRLNALFFCNIFARWVLQNTRIENITAMRCVRVWCFVPFVTDLQDGSYKNTRMRWWRCVALSMQCFTFCNIFARWVLQKHTRDMIASAIIIAMRCVRVWCFVLSVAYLQDGSYKNTRMRWWRDVLLSRCNASHFVTYLQDGSYKNTRVRW